MDNSINLIGTVPNPSLKVLFLGYGKNETCLIDELLKNNCEVWHSKKNILNLDEEFDMAISFGYQYILKKEFLDNISFPILNLHIAYLPWNKGAHPNFWSFYDNTPSGVTIHLIDAGIDTGDVLYQRRVKFNRNENTFSKTYKRLINEIESLFIENMSEIILGNYIGKKQTEKGTYHNLIDLPKSFKGWDVIIDDEIKRLKTLKNVLITGIGGDLGQSISRVISESFNDIDIFGTDIGELNSASLFCKDLYLLPRADNNLYIEKLCELIDQLEIDLIIPSTEQEQSEISKRLVNNKLKNVKVLGCFNEIYQIGKDKLKTVRWLSSIGVNVPKTVVFDECSNRDIELMLEKERKFILKPRTGSGSRNVIIVENITQIPVFVYKESSEWIIQEWIPDEEGEYTIAVSIIDQEKKYIQLRRILNYGSTSYAETVENEEISKVVESIINNLSEDTAFNIQLRLKNGIPSIFEINPRFSSTVYARHIMGFPDLANWVSKSLIKDKKFEFDFNVGDKFYRYFSYKVKRIK